MSQPGWEPPRALSELDRAEQLERETQKRRECVADCKRLHLLLPKSFQAPQNELLTRAPLHPGLVRRVNALSKPTLSAMLMGPTGAGKTTLVAVLLRRAFAAYVESLGEEFREVRGLKWVDAPELSLSERRHGLGDGKPQSVAEACHATLLVIDDIGNEPNQGPLLEVLRFRYNNCLPTLATSGLTRKQLSEQIGGAGVRRLNEQHAGYPVLNIDVNEDKTAAAAKPNGKKA